MRRNKCNDINHVDSEEERVRGRVGVSGCRGDGVME